MDDTARSPYPVLTEAHLAAIGRVTVEHSTLQIFLSGFIWLLISSNQEIGQIVTSTLNFRGHVELLRALVGNLAEHGAPGEIVESIRSVLKQAETVNSERNELVHALGWIERAPEEVVRVNRQRFGVKPKVSPASVQELNSVADRIAATTSELAKAMGRFLDAAAQARKPGDE